MIDHDRIIMLESENQELKGIIMVLQARIDYHYGTWEKLMDYLPETVFSDMLSVLKYGDRKHPGEEWKRETVQHHLDHAMAHIKKYWWGMHLDPETGRSQLAHAFVRIGMAMALEACHE